MITQKSFAEILRLRAGSIALLCILIAQFLHNVSFQSGFFYNSIILGGIAALGIDLALVSMSLYKDELLKSGELAITIKAVTVIVLCATGLANMAEGFKSSFGQELSVSALGALDWLQMSKWIGGTAVFPVLTYILADTIGTRNLYQLYRQGEKEKDKPQRQTSGGGAGAGVDAIGKNGNAGAEFSAAGVSAFQNQKQERLWRMAHYFVGEPGAHTNNVAQSCGVSPETIRNYARELGYESLQKFREACEREEFTMRDVDKLEPPQMQARRDFLDNPNKEVRRMGFQAYLKSKGLAE